jgi:O-acetyl-ADP-ribose deacetylase (regulator of RNase III)
MKVTVSTCSLELVQADITGMNTDAIVNAADCRLIMGGGVAGAISRKAGPSVQRECDQLAPIDVGHAVATGAGNLPARFVIHAVGPKLGEGDEDAKLAAATLNSLKLADEKHLDSIAFPAISTGIFRYPVERCAHVMLSTTLEYLRKGSRLKRVVFCLYAAQSYQVFERELQRLVA